MADFYPYLIASLPTLYFGMKPPHSFERFCDICCPLIPEKDCRVLRTLPQPEQYPEKGRRPRVIRKWIEFDTALRNELVRIRATKKHIDPATHLRPDVYTGPALAPAGMTAAVTTSVLDAEKALDEVRWKALEDLARGHYFDLDVLITYAYKLLILQRWENIRSTDGAILLERALQQ